MTRIAKLWPGALLVSGCFAGGTSVTNPEILQASVEEEECLELASVNEAIEALVSFQPAIALAESGSCSYPFHGHRYGNCPYSITDPLQISIVAYTASEDVDLVYSSIVNLSCLHGHPAHELWFRGWPVRIIGNQSAPLPWDSGLPAGDFEAEYSLDSSASDCVSGGCYPALGDVGYERTCYSSIDAHSEETLSLRRKDGQLFASTWAPFSDEVGVLVGRWSQETPNWTVEPENVDAIDGIVSASRIDVTWRNERYVHHPHLGWYLSQWRLCTYTTAL